MVGDWVRDMVLAGEASLGAVDRGAGVGIPVDGPALGGLAGDRLDGQAAVGALVVVQQVAAVEPQLLAGLGAPVVVLGDPRIAAAHGRRCGAGAPVGRTAGGPIPRPTDGTHLDRTRAW